MYRVHPKLKKSKYTQAQRDCASKQGRSKGFIKILLANFINY